MTAFILKIIASVCMLLDHIGMVFPAYVPGIFRAIGRIAFPIYAYMIAQGCKHTKDINKYLLRLGIFALISEIPYDIAFFHYMRDDTFNLGINFIRNTNVFYTLFLGAACIAVYEKLKTKKRAWLALLPGLLVPATLLANFLPDSFIFRPMDVAAIVMGLYTAGVLCFAHFLPENEHEHVSDIPFSNKIIPFLVPLPFLLTAGIFSTDYAAPGVALIFTLYLFKPENKISRTIVLAAGVIYLYGLNLFNTYGEDINGMFVITGRSLNQYELRNLLFAFIAIVLLFFYNGKQGRKAKWAFYAFYPVHISILAIIWYISTFLSV